jgi:predicted enzyme related to lactoylglutathione lyase
VIERIAFTVYPVTDMKRARRFYEEELGLQLSTKPHDVWVEYDPPGGCFALSTTMKPSDAGGGVIAFEVENVDALTEKLRARGTPVKMEPIQTPVCRMALVTDPEGNRVLLHQLLKKRKTE